MLFGRGTAFAQTPPAAPAPSGPFKLPPLGYDFGALEPHIDAQTMMIHHDRHHAAYVNNANVLAERWAELGTTPIEDSARGSRAKCRKRFAPAFATMSADTGTTRSSGILMTPGGAKEPVGDLKSAIDGAFGNLAAHDRQAQRGRRRPLRLGLGVACRQQGQEARRHQHANQDTPHSISARKAVIGVDVWEHAYYLKYQNRRADYLKSWWNTVNWDKAAGQFQESDGVNASL